MSVKKIISGIFNTIEQKSKLDLITELLTVNNSTEQALELFKKVNANFVYEMELRRKQNEKENNLIFRLNRIKPSYDENFDKKLEDLEINYELRN